MKRDHLISAILFIFLMLFALSMKMAEGMTHAHKMFRPKPVSSVYIPMPKIPKPKPIHIHKPR